MPSLRPVRLTVASLAALGALVVAPVASAEHHPSALATARDGDLVVSSLVLPIEHNRVALLGGWSKDSLPCTAWRTLRVKVDVFRTASSGSGQHRTDSKRRAVQNCAEGGPNVGFEKNARSLGMACADGNWRPGRYDMVVRTTHIATGVQAMASLMFFVRRTC